MSPPRMKLDSLEHTKLFRAFIAPRDADGNTGAAHATLPLRRRQNRPFGRDLFDVVALADLAVVRCHRIRLGDCTACVLLHKLSIMCGESVKLMRTL